MGPSSTPGSDSARRDNTNRRQRVSRALPALRAAFPVTTPILAGFLLTGATCGVFTVSLGFPWWMPTVMAVVVFAGSAEFVTASLMAELVSPWTAFATIFIVNARHLFYGLPMLERFRDTGRKRPYLIYAMCDETFSLEYASEPPAGIDRGWYMFWITLLDQLYWVSGCTLGGTLGSVLPLDGVQGVGFAMTALFVVIFLDQWLREASHAGSLVGFAATAVALAVLGPDRFMIPALVLMLVVLIVLRGCVEPAFAQVKDQNRAQGEDRDGDRR